MIAELMRFGVVGVAAMATHWCVVALLVPLGMQPLLANVIGFCIAFNVSFLGHHHWTFATASTQPHSNNRPSSSNQSSSNNQPIANNPSSNSKTDSNNKKETFKRFAGVAILGFVSNEVMYALLLKFTHMDYRAALFIVLIAVAGMTYLLSRFWAFRQQ